MELASSSLPVALEILKKPKLNLAPMGVLPSQIQLANHDFSLNCNDFNWMRIRTGRIENYRNLLSMQGGALKLGSSSSLAQAVKFIGSVKLHEQSTILWMELFIFF